MFQSVRITTHDCQKDFSRRHLDSRHSSLLDTESHACPPCTGPENRSALTGTQGLNPCLSASARRFETQCFPKKLRVFSGFLCVDRPNFWLHRFALCHANLMLTCAIPCKPVQIHANSTAPYAAPRHHCRHLFSGVFRHLAGLRNRCIAGGQHPPCQPIPSCDRSDIPSPAGCVVRQCFATLAWEQGEVTQS